MLLPISSLGLCREQLCSCVLGPGTTTLPLENVLGVVFMNLYYNYKIASESALTCVTSI